MGNSGYPSAYVYWVSLSWFKKIQIGLFREHIITIDRRAMPISRELKIASFLAGSPLCCIGWPAGFLITC